MSFRSQEIENFLNFFEERKERIRHFPGCLHLELWQDEHQPQVFFTYSIWQDESMLDHYRFSDFFKETWAATRALFEEKPEAWTLLQRFKVE